MTREQAYIFLTLACHQHVFDIDNQGSDVLKKMVSIFYLHVQQRPRCHYRGWPPPLNARLSTFSRRHVCHFFFHLLRLISLENSPSLPLRQTDIFFLLIFLALTWEVFTWMKMASRRRQLKILLNTSRIFWWLPVSRSTPRRSATSNKNHAFSTITTLYQKETKQNKCTHYCKTQWEIHQL